jgi:hypothetical protein
LDRQADATLTGANGQDWLARGQIWLVVALRNETHTVRKYRGGNAVPGGRPPISRSLSCQGRQRRERDLIRKLEHLTGKTVTLQPGPGEQPAA